MAMRHVARPPKSGDKQVFSGGNRRCMAVALLVLLLLAVLVTAMSAVRIADAAMVNPAPYNSDANLPGVISAEMNRCVQGQVTQSNVPVIGDGAFRRVVEARQIGGATYAVDPFTGNVQRPLTLTDLDALHGCRYAVDRYGVVPPRTIALTYDDGPNDQWTPQILDVLKRSNVQATFFDVGSWIAAHPDVFRREIADGHAVGNHTYYHHELSTEGAATARSELSMTSQAMAVVGNLRTGLFRPPYGGGDTISVWDDRQAIRLPSKTSWSA